LFAGVVRTVRALGKRLRREGRESRRFSWASMKYRYTRTRGILITPLGWRFVNVHFLPQLIKKSETSGSYQGLLSVVVAGGQSPFGQEG